MKRTGFTLIELLVLLGIVMVLGALLVPALQSALGKKPGQSIPAQHAAKAQSAPTLRPDMVVTCSCGRVTSLTPVIGFEPTRVEQ